MEMGKDRWNSGSRVAEIVKKNGDVPEQSTLRVFLAVWNDHTSNLLSSCML
jgi:hypothetical protein